MRIDLATTQPVRQPGVPGAPGAPKPDGLGLTLRERLWLTRAALATILASFIVSLGLLTMLPSEQARPAGALEHQLAERALRPLPPERPQQTFAPLPAAEIQRPAMPEVESESEQIPLEPLVAAPKPALASEERPLVSKPARRVQISRGGIAARSLPAPPAVDLSRPQSLAPRRVEAEPEQPVSRPQPAKEPELKRPSFE